MSDMERGPGGVEDVTQHQCQGIPHHQQEYKLNLVICYNLSRHLLHLYIYTLVQADGFKNFHQTHNKLS